VVRRQHNGPALAQLPAEAVVEDVLADVGVDGAENVVEDQHAGARVHGAREHDAPALAAREVDPVDADFRVQAVLKQ
jgi:hypothetical protein